MSPRATICYRRLSTFNEVFLNIIRMFLTLSPEIPYPSRINLTPQFSLSLSFSHSLSNVTVSELSSRSGPTGEHFAREIVWKVCIQVSGGSILDRSPEDEDEDEKQVRSK